MTRASADRVSRLRFSAVDFKLGFIVSDFDEFIASLSALGVDEVSSRLSSGSWANRRKSWAQDWLSAQESARKEVREEASLIVAADDNAVAREANDIARLAREDAREANDIARAARKSSQVAADSALEANAIARDSNAIASRANDSAREANELARTANITSLATAVATNDAAATARSARDISRYACIAATVAAIAAMVSIALSIFK